MFPPEPEPWLLDLFQMSQASIASDDEMLIFGKRRRRRSSMEVLTDQHFERTMLRTNPVLGAMSREGDKVSSFVFDLMNLAPSERQKAARRRPYQSLVLAGLRLGPYEGHLHRFAGARSAVLAKVADEIEAQLGP